MTALQRPRLRPVHLPDLDLVAGDAHALEPGDQRDRERLTADGVVRVGASRASLQQCSLEFTDVDDVDLEHARLIECLLKEPGVTTLRAAEATWRGVEICGGRIAALEAPEARWDAVRISGARIGYLNLRDAAVTDAVIADCRVDTLDLASATLTRVQLSDCRIGELITTHATLRHVDLRGTSLQAISGVLGLAGAVVSPEQLVDLAGPLAEACGLQVE